MQVGDSVHELDRLAFDGVLPECLDRALRGVACQHHGVDVLPLLEVGERVVRDQGVPLLQGRGVDRLGEPEPFLADLRDGGDHLHPGEVAAEDGVPAIDVGCDVLEPRFRERFAERGRGELGGSADAAEEQDVRGLGFGFRHGVVLRTRR